MIRSDFFLAIGWVVYAGARRTVVVGGGGVLVPSVFISYIHVVCMQPIFTKWSFKRLGNLFTQLCRPTTGERQKCENFGRSVDH